MSLNIPLRKRWNDLKPGEPALGCWLTLNGTTHARTVASVPGLSWICIDAEHGRANDTDIYELTNAIASTGTVSPLVRVPVEDPWWIKRVLDAGAHGVVVPLIHNADMARKVVAACKYPPLGIRGFGPLHTHATGLTGLDYGRVANQELLTIVQIESVEAVNNVEEIAAVEGIDATLIGPFDLSMSLGVAPGSPEHEAAIRKILAGTQKAGKKCCMFCIDGAQAAKRRADGFDMISVAVDVDTIYEGFKRHIAQALGQDEAQGAAGGYGSK